MAKVEKTINFRLGTRDLTHFSFMREDADTISIIGQSFLIKARIFLMTYLEDRMMKTNIVVMAAKG
jgi:hypothetical protein